MFILPNKLYLSNELHWQINFEMIIPSNVNVSWLNNLTTAVNH
ncbi:MAG: hypothetical protein ACTS6A_01085 [Candidatus Hodgkinia cicadicola]